MTNDEIMQKAAEVYVACDIHSFPVNCVEIIKTYGYRVYTYSYLKTHIPRLYDCCRNYSADSFKHTGLGCVMFNDACSQGRILFSLAHEIGHIALGHDSEEPEYEAEANTFAGHLLAPCVMIDYYNCRSYEDVKNRFGLSTAAANIAWQNFIRWKRFGPGAADTDLRNWILYLRRPIEITEENMFRVDPFESIEYESTTYKTIPHTTNKKPPEKNKTEIDAAADDALPKAASTESMLALPVQPPPVTAKPSANHSYFEKMRDYHRKRRKQIEKELEEVQRDMDCLDRANTDFLQISENNWLYKNI